MTVSPSRRPARPQLRLVPRRSHDDSPEALLLRLGPEIRRLSGERPFREELLLMEQVFLLLLEGFRPQALLGGRIGLLPPQPERAGFMASVPVSAPAPAPAEGQPCPASAQDQAIASLCKAGMDWVASEGQAAVLCFPARML